MNVSESIVKYDRDLSRFAAAIECQRSACDPHYLLHDRRCAVAV